MNHVVVIYGENVDYRPASWLFWVLEVHGHAAVAVLIGGVPAWTLSGGALKTEEVRKEMVHFVAQFRPERLADVLAVRRAIRDRSAVILDSRGFKEYTGEKGEPQLRRTGHIPTAIHRDAQSLYSKQNEICSIKTLDELHGLYDDLKGKRVYTYCNTGRSASLNYLALRVLGIDAAVYDGSWTEWSSNENLPVVKGPEPGEFK